MRRAHNERCRACKTSVKNLLAARFGVVQRNWDLGLPSRLEDYKSTSLYDALSAIYDGLQKHRGYDHFVKVKKLPRVDFFIPQQSMIVEFDESQHFTKPRDITLSLYPGDHELGFSVSRWRALCRKLLKQDNDPPFRDEQRAWYDTLRDFAPMCLKIGQITRLYSRDLVWCSLNPRNGSDLRAFEQVCSQCGEQVNDEQGSPPTTKRG